MQEMQETKQEMQMQNGMDKGKMLEEETRDLVERDN